MLIKFATPSDRVKGLSFHPKRPWLLTGLHTGSIQMWDYRQQTLIDKFEDHEGPVRSIQFHPTLSLFCSGGDDFKVRVWNYKTKKCAFVLKGHLDFVRCVSFHNELPWVISASDDQTARIWNYQSRQMIAILTGHCHYVMNCSFHPNKDLIITCSLDQTLRLWSYAPLRKKYAAKKPNQDVTLSGSEIELIQIMEGHNAGINWCAFHAVQQLIVSSADDKKIKLWKFTETRCWEADQLSGHTNNVSSVVFHPKAEVLISDSEDKTTRIWDLNKKIEIDCFTNKELDRFWVVAAHPDNYYFACGSDSALYVFALFKDRISFSLISSNFLCVGVKKTIKFIDLNNGTETIIRTLVGLSSLQDNLLQDNIESLITNPYETAQTQILVRLRTSKSKDAQLPKHLLVIYDPKKSTLQQKAISMFYAKTAIFVGKNKLIKVGQLGVIEQLNYEINQTTVVQTDTIYTTSKLFQVPGGKVLFVSDEMLCLLDPINKKITNTIEINSDIAGIKQIVWTYPNNNFFASLTKKTITIFTKSLTKLYQLTEKSNIKSAVWVNQSIILYTTKQQLKFLILNGDTGVLKSTEEIFYLAQCVQDQKGVWTIYGMDNKENFIKHPIDLSEPLFKHALYEKNIPLIQQYLSKHSNLGDSLVSYLYQKKYYSLAINLVQEKKARFSLAINSNNLEVSFKICQELKDRQCYQQLAQEAMRQGNHCIVEIAYQQLKEFDKLSTFYAFLGDKQSQVQMQSIAKQRGDVDSRFQATVLLGDIKERVKILLDSEQYNLAYLSAITHGLQEEASQILPFLEKSPQSQQNLQESIFYVKNFKSTALLPPAPLIRSAQSSQIFSINWPHNFIAEDDIIILSGEKESQILQEEIEKENEKEEVLLASMDYQQPKKEDKQQDEPNTNEEDTGQWGIDDDELIQDKPIQQTQTSAKQPQQQGSQTQTSIKYDQLYFRSGITQDSLTKKSTSKLGIDHFRTLNNKVGIQTLKKQIGLINLEPLKNLILQMNRTSYQFVTSIPFISPSELTITNEQQNEPYIYFDLNHVRNSVKNGYKTTTEGKFSETLSIFMTAIQKIPLVKAQSSLEVLEVRSLIQMCRHYIMAMRLELNKKSFAENPERQLELSCYMTLCNLQPAHRTLTLRAAMTQAFKLKNFVTAAFLAKKLIALINSAPPNSPYAKPEIAANAQKVLSSCESSGTNALKITFDEQWLNDELALDKICSSTLSFQNIKVRCPYDYSGYGDVKEGIVCQVCGLCQVGCQALGLNAK